VSLYKVSTPVTGTKFRLGRDTWWLALLAGVVLFTALMWASAISSGLITSGRPASVGWDQAALGLVGLLQHPGNPAAGFPRGTGVGGAVPFWLSFVVLGVTVFAGGRWLWRWWGQRRTEGTDGLATRRQLLDAMGEKQALSRASSLRPGLVASGAEVRVDDVAVSCGTAEPTGVPLWATIEESVLMVAPPRAGKTQGFILPGILAFRGSVFATSSKVDVLYSTAELRREFGPVWALDPTGLSGWPNQLAWPLTAGCENYQTARKRAETLSKTTKTEEGTRNGGYFALNAQSLLTCWLHAAALGNKHPMALLKWATSPEIREAVELLAQHGRQDLAQELGSQHDAAPEERSATWRTASQSLVALYDSRVAEIFAPAPGKGNFDIETWLRAGGTVFLVGEDEEGSALAPLMAAFAQAVFDTAKTVAARMPNGRLELPLGVFGDELANVAPLPQIPQLMSVAGSQNIFVVVVLQSLAQAQERWGELGVKKMFGSSTLKILLGGISEESELKAYSALAGEFDEDTESISDSEGSTSVSVSVRRRSVLEPGDIRMLRQGEGLVVHRQTPATRARFTRAFEGPRAAEIAAANERALELVSRAQ
jgi:type IV secretory pathway TraG/TraD family ATPase VirD4